MNDARRGDLVGFVQAVSGGNEGPGGGPNCREAPATCRKSRARRRRFRQPPDAELESAASVGSSGREVKKTTWVRGYPRITLSGPVPTVFRAPVRPAARRRSSRSGARNEGRPRTGRPCRAPREQGRASPWRSRTAGSVVGPVGEHLTVIAVVRLAAG